MESMRVKHKDEKTLVIVKEPTFLAIAIYFSFLVAAGAIVVLGDDSVLYRIFFGFGACCMSYILLSNYEIWIFDKEQSEVSSTSVNWCRYLLSKVINSSLNPNILAKLEDIQDVQVEAEDEEAIFKKGHQIVLKLRNGQRMGMAETNAALCEQMKIKDDIKEFIQDCEITGRDADDEAEDASNSSGNEEEDVSTEDDFEQISPAELESLKESGDIPSDPSTQPESVGAAEAAGDAGTGVEAGKDQDQASS